MNAKKELNTVLSLNNSALTCAFVTLSRLGQDSDCTYKLREGYSENDLNEFMDKLDFVYDINDGIQNVYGILWFEDGSWAQRRDLGGFEDWITLSVPDKDMYFLNK